MILGFGLYHGWVLAPSTDPGMWVRTVFTACSVPCSVQSTLMNRLPGSSLWWRESACYHCFTDEEMPSEKVSDKSKVASEQPQSLCPVGRPLNHPLPPVCSNLGYMCAKGTHGVPETGLRGLYVPTEGLDFCHFCSEGGPELDLVCWTLRHNTRLWEA